MLNQKIMMDGIPVPGVENQQGGWILALVGIMYVLDAEGD